MLITGVAAMSVFVSARADGNRSRASEALEVGGGFKPTAVGADFRGEPRSDLYFPKKTDTKSICSLQLLIRPLQGKS
jgi:hypothetical protein